MLARKTAQTFVKQWAHQTLTGETPVDALELLLALHKPAEQALILAEKRKFLAQIQSHTVKVTLSSAKQDWLTPPYFLEIVRRFGPIALDPCGNPWSFVRAWWTYFGPPNHICGLMNSWWVPEDTVCFVNPPYGRTLHLWAMKMASEYGNYFDRSQGSLIALIPARTGTGYWEQFIWPFADAVCFWHGGRQYPSRMCFYDLSGRPADTGATFDAAVVYFGNRRDRFKEVFEPYGTVQLVN